MRFWPVIVVLLGKRFDPDVVIEDRRTVNGPAQESLFYKAANLRTSVHCFSCSLTRLDVHSSLLLPNVNLVGWVNIGIKQVGVESASFSNRESARELCARSRAGLCRCRGVGEHRCRSRKLASVQYTSAPN
jgi:hypothetical protein